MIYDKSLSLYTLEGSTPLNGVLEPYGEFLCAEREVFHRRYWEAVQAGATIDAMVEMVGHLTAHEKEFYAELSDGNLYRVEQIQRSHDEHGLAVTVLSLSRSDRRFNILKKE